MAGINSLDSVGAGTPAWEEEDCRGSTEATSSCLAVMAEVLLAAGCVARFGGPKTPLLRRARCLISCEGVSAVTPTTRVAGMVEMGRGDKGAAAFRSLVICPSSCLEPSGVETCCSPRTGASTTELIVGRAIIDPRRETDCARYDGEETTSMSELPHRASATLGQGLRPGW